MTRIGLLLWCLCGVAEAEILLRSLALSPTGRFLAMTEVVEARTCLVVADLETGTVTLNLYVPGREEFDRVAWATECRLVVSKLMKARNSDEMLFTGEFLAMDYDGSAKVMLTGCNTSCPREDRRLLTTRANSDHDVSVAVLGNKGVDILAVDVRQDANRRHAPRIGRAPAETIQLASNGGALMPTAALLRATGDTRLAYREDDQWRILADTHADASLLATTSTHVYVTQPHDGQWRLLRFPVGGTAFEVLASATSRFTGLLRDADGRPWAAEVDAQVLRILAPQHPFARMVDEARSALGLPIIKLQGNDDGTRFLIVTASPDHRTLYLLDAATGGIQRLFEARFVEG